MAKTPDWFEQAVTTGIQRLLVLSLDRTPAMELIEGTVDAWCDALWPGRDWRLSDSDRITEAFRTLSRTRDQWPAPRDFLAALPERKQLALPERKWTDAELQANRERLVDMVNNLFSAWKEDEQPEGEQ